VRFRRQTGKRKSDILHQEKVDGSGTSALALTLPLERDAEFLAVRLVYDASARAAVDIEPLCGGVIDLHLDVGSVVDHLDGHGQERCIGLLAFVVRRIGPAKGEGHKREKAYEDQTAELSHDVSPSLLDDAVARIRSAAGQVLRLLRRRMYAAANTASMMPAVTSHHSYLRYQTPRPSTSQL